MYYICLIYILFKLTFATYDWKETNQNSKLIRLHHGESCTLWKLIEKKMVLAVELDVAANSFLCSDRLRVE